MYAVVTVLATSLVCSTVAIKACDDSIVEKLQNVGDCYTDGKPPTTLMINEMHRVVRISDGETPTGNVCTSINSLGDYFQLNFHFSMDQYKACIFQETNKGSYYEETLIGGCDNYNEGSIFKLYPIHHESNVYSYYRCIEGDDSGGEDAATSHMGVVAVHHEYDTNDYASVASVVEKTERCFTALGITVKPVDPCDFRSQTTTGEQR